MSGQRHGGGGSGGGSLEESPLQGLLDTWGWLLWARIVSIDAAGWHAHLVPDVETEASVWPVSGPKQHKQQQWGCEHSLSPSDDVSYLLSPSPVPHPIPDARWARGWVFPVFELTDGFHPGSQRDTGFRGSHGPGVGGFSALLGQPWGCRGRVQGSLERGRLLDRASLWARSPGQLTSAPHTWPDGQRAAAAGAGRAPNPLPAMPLGGVSSTQAQKSSRELLLQEPKELQDSGSD